MGAIGALEEGEGLRKWKRLALILTLICVAAPFGPRAFAAKKKPGPASVTAATAPDTARVERMNVPQAIQAQGKGEIVLVDVRPAPQRAVGHIRDDLAAPLDGPSVELPAGKKLVFYCSCLAEELALEAARASIRKGRADVAVLVGGFDAWREAGAPVSMEASWEQVFRVDQAPVGWGKTPVDSFRCRYARDDDVAFSGRSSGRIGCLADTATRSLAGLAGLIQRVDAAPALGRTVRLTAAVKAEHVTGVSYLWLGAEDAQGKLIMMKREESTPIRGFQEWHFLGVIADVPADAARILVGLSMAGAGVVWLDEVKLRVEEAGDLPAKPLLLRNPGFED
jgi:rhodanese-related sulfurtransferase